jgi:hypothetical protein
MRKEKTVIIDTGDETNRDHLKMFRIKEMSAMRAEKWAIRAMLALARSKPEIPDEVAQGGLASVARFAIEALSGLSFAEAEPLMDEMMQQCVFFVPDQTKQLKTAITENDIDEISTLVFLRAEVLDLHTGFSLRGAISKSISGIQTAAPGPNT